MALQMGDYNQLEVYKELEYAYLLNNPDEPVFLHKKQTTATLDLHELVDVFLYYDSQKRVTATMRKPLVDLQRADFCEVVDVNYRLGAFINIGLVKDLLLSKDDLPFVKNEWPAKGDKIFITLRVSKSQLTAKPVSRYNVKEYLKPTEHLEVGEKYTAYNLYKAEEGNVFFTTEGHYIFVYFKHMRKVYRLGEKADIQITIDKEDYTYNGRITLQKELMMTEDAQLIEDYLKQAGGEMPFTDKSSSEDIMNEFHMSKGAFKRALGNLYKAEKVVLEKGKTRLL